MAKITITGSRVTLQRLLELILSEISVPKSIDDYSVSISCEGLEPMPGSDFKIFADLKREE